MELLDKLGLTQTQMADWLRVSRSQISMNKGNKRGLTGAPLRKLSDLEILVNNVSKRKKQSPAYAKPQADIAVKVLKRCILINELNAKKTEMKLELATKTYSRHTLLLEVLAELEKNKEAHDALDQSTIKVIKNMATSSIQRYGLHVQSQLQLQLKTYQFIVSQAQEQLAEIKKI